MPIQFLYNSTYCKIDGQYPRDILYKATSYTVPGAFFIKKHLKRNWDGRQSLLLNRKTTEGTVSYFPTGLIYHVKKAFENAGHKDITISTNLVAPPMENNPLDLVGVQPRDYQIETVE